MCRKLFAVKPQAAADLMGMKENILMAKSALRQ
jgi:hypothetical protein